ncbi:zinc-binding metallopeptidase family protein [Diaphorobacter caeni]|uniref:zinc-binding metallopeptidase family protein n=1 Tax=Diaphorobacter caeni TaxID=2784387 RepID=UPI00189076A0|nr:putative zinc-binding metallopeptidase [Diaphorobacter caeni]MBF5003047.1 putative zinc-binding metallopeptidase [Diaphorobacter caeni]
MRLFHCGHCGFLVFFESFQCVHCGSTLAFVREHVDVVALIQSGDGSGLYERRLPRPGLQETHENTSSAGVSESEAPYLRYQMCANRTRYGACNFALIHTPGTPEDALCRACQHTRVLPDLSDPLNVRRWGQIESAKRRLYYIDIRLGLDPLPGESGPVFEFLADLPGATPVLTGHASGVITLNVAEADDDERVRRRLAFHEPYRTLLGHLRHEIGHYFWDALIARGEPRLLEEFRALFGDERQDYAQALQNYYARTPVPDAEWHDTHVSAYATAHPWEDWAETWAHYLHLVDLLETAKSFDTQINVPSPLGDQHFTMIDPFIMPPPPFESMLSALVPTTLLLNSLTRSLGQIDAYPFALSARAQEKMRFVHEVISERRIASAAQMASPHHAQNLPVSDT